MVKDGTPMGCRDTSRPEKYTNEQLSRVKDALDALVTLPDERKEFWASLPFELKTEFNYARWIYRAPR